MTPRGAGDLRVTRWGARFLGRDMPCAIGRGGITTDKREGDGATPAGIHRLVAVHHRADRVRLPGARITGPRDIWSDDPQDPGYNGLAQAPSAVSHERMFRADPLYDVVGITDWNLAPPVPGRGSAIFLHRWRKPRHPTEGCIAFAPHDLMWILARWRPDFRIVVQA